MLTILFAISLAYPLDPPEVNKPDGLSRVIAEAVRIQQARRAEIEYFRSIQRAHDAWQADQFRRTREMLDGVPWEPRGWEWRYLRPAGK